MSFNLLKSRTEYKPYFSIKIHKSYQLKLFANGIYFQISNGSGDVYPQSRADLKVNRQRLQKIVQQDVILDLPEPIV